MRRLASALLLAVMAGAAITAPGCTDVGDSSAAPGLGGALGAVDDDAEVAESAADGASPAQEETSAPGAVDDATSSSAIDSGGDDAAPPSTGSDDAGTFDAGFDGTSPEDASGPDTGVVDTGAPDATVFVDSGPADAGAATDSGLDAAHGDAGFDASAPLDSGFDAGKPVLTACTSAGQTNCVQCQYNNGGSGTLPNVDQVCTPTEAALVARDVATGQATVAGPDPAGSCYQCAALSGCLDDSEFADTGHECEDIADATGKAQCEATLACILGSSCGASALSVCYCGTAPVSGSCAAVGSTNAANGACEAAEATGLGFASNDGLDILKNFTSTTLPAGVANNIFQCATSNNCTTCLQ